MCKSIWCTKSIDSTLNLDESKLNIFFSKIPILKLKKNFFARRNNPLNSSTEDDRLNDSTKA